MLQIGKIFEKWSFLALGSLTVGYSRGDVAGVDERNR